MRKVLLEYIINKMNETIRGYHYVVFFITKLCVGISENIRSSFPEVLPISFKYINGIRNATISMENNEYVVVNCIFNGMRTTFRCPLNGILKVHDYFSGEGVLFDSGIVNQNNVSVGGVDADAKAKNFDVDDIEIEKKVVEKKGRKFIVYTTRRKNGTGNERDN